jgi:hypothetical protein
MKPIHWFVGLMLLVLAGLWAFLAKQSGSTAYAVSALVYALGAMLMISAVRHALGRIIGRELKGGLLLTFMAVFFLAGYFIQYTGDLVNPPSSEPPAAPAGPPRGAEEIRPAPTDTTAPDSGTRTI